MYAHTCALRTNAWAAMLPFQSWSVHLGYDFSDWACKPGWTTQVRNRYYATNLVDQRSPGWLTSRLLNLLKILGHSGRHRLYGLAIGMW